MIDFLTGQLAEKTPGKAVLQVGGVGYQIKLPQIAAGALPAVGQSCTVYTHLAVSENDMSLYGFATREEREMFLLLTAVSGVGPKAGLSILSALTPAAIVLAVSAGDHKAFAAASGVGPKMGQRLVLELRDKVAKGAVPGGFAAADVQAKAGGGAAGQALAALVGLGYSHGEAAGALAQVDSALPVEEMVRIALRGMAGH